MADIKSIPETVEQAECHVYVSIAEAQSLMELYGNASTSAEVDGWATLARGVMERFVDAFEVYRQLLREQGHPVVEPVRIGSVSHG